MPIKFYNGKPKPPRIDMLSIPPAREVRFMGDEKHSVIVMLHWLNGRSLPCMDDECTICPKRSFPYGYAPVIVTVADGKGKAFEVPRILPITERCLELAQKDMRNKLVRVYRSPNTQHGKMYYEVIKELEPQTFKPFDVLALLKLIWDRKYGGVVPGQERDSETQSLLPFNEVG